jgi:O-antigen ligase
VTARLFPLHPIRPALLAALAIASGLLIASLPIRYSLALLGGAALVGLSVWEPAIGLGCAIVLGPARAYLAATGYYGPLYDPGQIFFALALAGWLLRGALRHEINVPRLGLILPLSAFIFIGLLSLYNAPEWRDGLNEAIKWAEVIVTLIIARAEAQRGRARWLVAAILLSGVIQAGVGLWQYGLRGDGPIGFRLPDGHYRAYGSFEQPNPYGGFLGLIWPIAAGLALAGFKEAGRTRRLSALLPPSFFLLVSSFILLGIYLSFSRGAWLGAAAAAGMLVLFFPRRLHIGLGLGAAALIAGWVLIQAGLAPASITTRLADVPEFLAVSDVRGVNINDANFAIVERLAHWQAAQAMIDAHPWLGVGLGNYTSAYSQYSLINWPAALGHAHNIYLHTWAETGLLGLIAYLSLWATAIVLTLRTLKQTSGVERGLALGLSGVWAHLLIHQIVDNLHVNNNDLLIAALFGMLYALQSPSAPLFKSQMSAG